MGSARYIGRVGGLAVALGVGTAIAMGHGVAFADATDAASSNTTPSDPSPAGGSTPPESTSTQTTGTSPTTSKSTPASGPLTGSSTTAEAPGTADATDKTSSTTTSHLGPGVVVSAQTTTGTSSGTETAKKPEELPSTPVVLPPAETTTSPTDTKDPEDTKEEPTSHGSSKSTKDAGGTGSAPVAAAAVSARTVSTVAEPATEDDEPDTAPVDDAADPAASGVTITTMAAAVVVRPAPAPEPVAAAPQAPLAAVTSLVSNVINWVLGPMAGTAPTTPAQPPLVWTMLAFARREFENVLSRFGVGGTADSTLAVASTSLALAAQPVPVLNVPAFPLPGTQLSPSTQFVNWVTGDYQTGNALMADTLNRFGISGTDVGVMWDNGIPDDPRTPYNEHQVLMAFGDTFGNRSVPGEEWRFNTLLRSSDTTLANGMDIPNGEWFNGNMFGGTPLGNPTFGRQIIGASGLPAGVTLIPTAGISIPTPGTRFGATQYVNFMSVSQWGAPGQWTTNYSAIAYSVDNGENWTVAPSTVRYNQPWGGNQNFQQAAYVRPGDGYVYTYGTPNGRQGAAYVARVPEAAILDLTQYEYYSKGQSGFFGWGATPAGWIKNNPAAASPVFGQEGGACGAVNAGNTVSELSVQYNKQLGKFVTLYTDQNNSVVMRTSSSAQGGWSNASVLVTQQPGGIYAPMMHPWSPSTMGTGTDLYWNLSNWNEYNVMLMRTDLTKV